MATFVELHVFNSGKRISISVETISLISELEGKPPYGAPVHGAVKTIDGSSVETVETYDQIQKAIMSVDGSGFLVPVPLGGVKNDA